MISRLTVVAALVALGAPLSGATSDPANPRTVGITAGDNMKYSVTEIVARRGERLRIVLTSTGTMPKMAMAHNVVVLAKGTDANAFIDASTLARDDGFIAQTFMKNVLAATQLAGNGETVEASFDAPKTAGRYDFVCSVPGHYLAGMRGVLVVT